MKILIRFSLAIALFSFLLPWTIQKGFFGGSSSDAGWEFVHGILEAANQATNPSPLVGVVALFALSLVGLPVVALIISFADKIASRAGNRIIGIICLINAVVLGVFALIQNVGSELAVGYYVCLLTTLGSSVMGFMLPGQTGRAATNSTAPVKQ
jgi:hypothetical protein